MPRSIGNEEIFLMRWTPDHLHNLLVSREGPEPLQEEWRPQVVFQPLDVLWANDVTGGRLHLHLASSLSKPAKKLGRFIKHNNKNVHNETGQL
jgi:hypothetical protein